MRILKVTEIFVIIVLSSCVHNSPKISEQTRCTASYEFNYGSDNDIQSFFNNIEDYKESRQLQKQFLRDVLAIFGSGKCHQYRVKKVKRVSAIIKVPLTELEDFTGFSLNSWGVHITPFGRESIRYAKRWCK